MMSFLFYIFNEFIEIFSQLINIIYNLRKNDEQIIRVKLEAIWTNDNRALLSRYKKQFIGNKEDRDIRFVINSTYDYIVLFGGPKDIARRYNPDKTIIFSMEPIWSTIESKDFKGISNNIIVADKSFYPNEDRYKDDMLKLFYGGHGDKGFKRKMLWHKEEILKYIPKKNKSISMIVSKDDRSKKIFGRTNDYTVLYDFRVQLALRISREVEAIDIWGFGWVPNGKNVKGKINNKKEALNDYRFSICIENSYQKNYISEKFWDAVLTNTVPIYIGCSNINDYIPEDYYINLSRYIDRPQEIISILQEINQKSEEFYLSFTNKIEKLKSMFFDDSRFNLHKKITNIILNK